MPARSRRGPPQPKRLPKGAGAAKPVAGASPVDADGNPALPQPFTLAYSVDRGQDARTVWSVVFTNDVLAIATSEVAPCIAEARTGALVATLLDAPVPRMCLVARALAACRDGTRIVASSPNKATFVHRLMATAAAAADGDDAAALAVPTRLQSGDSETWAVDITRCGRLCAVGDDAGVVRICDSATGDVVKTLRPHSSLVNAVAFSPDGAWLLSTSTDATAALTRLRLDDTSSDRAAAPNGAGFDEMYLRVQPAGWCFSAVFSPCGSRMAVADADDVVHVLSALDGTTVQMLPHSDRVNCIAFSPCGMLIATGGATRHGTGHTRLWRLRDAQPLHDFHSPARVSTVAFHPSGELLACGAHFPVVQVYHVPRSPSRLLPDVIPVPCLPVEVAEHIGGFGGAGDMVAACSRTPPPNVHSVGA